MAKHIPRDKRVPSQRSGTMRPATHPVPGGARVVESVTEQFTVRTTIRGVDGEKRLLSISYHYYDRSGKKRQGYRDFERLCDVGNVAWRIVDDRTMRDTYGKTCGHRVYEVTTQQSPMATLIAAVEPMLVANSTQPRVIVHALPRQGQGACSGDSGGIARKKIRKSIIGKDRRAQRGELVGIGRLTDASHNAPERRGHNVCYYRGYVCSDKGQFSAKIVGPGMSGTDYSDTWQRFTERPDGSYSYSPCRVSYVDGWFHFDIDTNRPKKAAKSPEEMAAEQRSKDTVLAQQHAFRNVREFIVSERKKEIANDKKQADCERLADIIELLRSGQRVDMGELDRLCQATDRKSVV